MASTSMLLTLFLSFAVTAFASEFNYSLSGHDWPELCVTGTRQSPINIVKKDAVDAGTSDSFGLEYTLSNSYSVINTGHVIQVVPENVSQNKLILRDGTSYKLLQFHFHGFSEHSFDGMFAPLEVHFVHQSEADPTKYAVVGCMFRDDPDEMDNNMLSEIIANTPSTASTVNVTGPYMAWSDLCLAATKKGSRGGGAGSSKGAVFRVYTYLGSLTTPGCGEVVEWFVLAKPQYISTSQVIKLYDAVAAVSHGVRVNNRMPQPLKGRTVSTFLAYK